jgi:hypothetical protein
VTREVRARRIIDALDKYLVRETVYPDSLQELVQKGDIPEIPEPAIGFGFLYDAKFRYQNFGTSFILEFPAPRWVECAYTPPFSDEGEMDDEGALEKVPSDEAAPSAAQEPPSPADEQGADAGEAQASESAGSEDGYVAQPNPADADYPDDAENAGDGEGETLGEAWSCPSKPPELW